MSRPRKEREPRNCEECNQPIECRRHPSREESAASYAKRRYCTRQCAGYATRSIMREKVVKVIPERVCKQCEKPFTPTRADGASKRVYCSRKCCEDNQAERYRVQRVAKRSDIAEYAGYASNIRPATRIKLAFLERPQPPKSQKEIELGL